MKSSRPAKKWDRNRSPVGWYVATYIERFEYEGENKTNLRRRCRAWENMILVKASTPAQAYRRAVQLAKKGGNLPWTNSRGEDGKLIFEGLTQLLPVYDELEDGAEICWTDHANTSVQKVKRMIKKKTELAAFQK
jgi:hypothetical protein